MTEKEKLKQEIYNLYCDDIAPSVEEIADFILARDKKRYGESVSLEALKANPQYKHIDIDAELNRAKQWIARNNGRKLTSRFFVNWLNRIEKPLEKIKEREAF